MANAIRTIDPATLTTPQLQAYLQFAIAPRPICFASTINKEGQVNLSPFSFFNLFSTRPPICIFSPSRRVRDNTTKHSLHNVQQVPEVVINIVNYAMVRQTSLASTDYPEGVNEFEKTGLTMEASQLVRPPRVREAPVQLECRVTEIKELGTQPGAGNLIFAEVMMIHIREEILDANGMIDQMKIDLVARLGANWYSRVTPESLFEVEKPLRTMGIGVDALPAVARHSTVLTGNDLGLLGNAANLPTQEMLQKVREDPEIKFIFSQTNENERSLIREQLHRLVKRMLDEGKTDTALAILWLE